MQVCQGMHGLRPPGPPTRGRSEWPIYVGLADAEILEDLLKHSNQEMGVEETIRFVEIRAAGKRLAASLTTPTTTNTIDEEEGGEAIVSNYRRQQQHPTARTGQGQAKTTPTRSQSNPTNHIPSPKPRATPTREQPQPGDKAKEHPLTRVYAPSAARQDTESMREQPTGSYTAQPSAPPA